MTPEVASNLAAGLISKPGVETSQFSLTKLQMYVGYAIGVLFALAAFFEAHEGLVKTAETVGPSVLSQALATLVPMVIALAGFLKAAKAHAIYHDGRVDFAASALQFLLDAGKGAETRERTTTDPATGAENVADGFERTREAKGA